MIKNVVGAFYIIGLLFWTGMLLSAIIKLIGYNELFEFYSFNQVQIKDYRIVSDSVKSETLNIFYNYGVDGKIYNKELVVSRVYFDKHFNFSTDSTLEIRYNSIFPKLSYIKSLPLEQRKQKVGIVISMIFLIFLSLLFFLGNVDKWAERYRKVLGQ